VAKPRPEFDGLLALTLRRIRETARAAGFAWALLVAVIALPLTRPWEEGGLNGVARWAAAVVLPILIVVAGSFVVHWSREARGRLRLRPSVRYQGGDWWLTIRPRESGEGMTSVRIKVTDEDGTSTTHEFHQIMTNEWIVDWFPKNFDATGTKGGRKQPWGHYTVRWEVLRPGRRSHFTTAEFDWHVTTV
jgi:hypothetical protein